MTVVSTRQTPSNYLYSNYRQVLRAPTHNLADRATPTDPLRPTWSLQVARRVARVAPSRSKLLDRAASSDQSRLKRSPERPRDAIFDDFGSILGPVLVVFRGCIARATRLGARRAEPLFLLAGAALSRVRRLLRKSENRRKSTKNCFDDALRMRCMQKARFFLSRMRLGVNFGRLGALPGAPGRTFWCAGSPLVTLRALLEGAGDAP